MAAKASPVKRVVSLALAASFLFVTAPDAFGIHGCPYHGFGDVATVAEMHPGMVHGTEHAGTETAELASAYQGDQGSGSGQPCTWLADCHACCVQASVRIDSPATLPATPVQRVARQVTESAQPPLGPRHGLFELHLPNAPPLFT